MKKAILPTWAKAICPGKIEIDAGQFYPELLKELMDDENWDKTSKLVHDEVDQYWLEVAFQCAKLDIQSAVSGTELMPKKGGALVISVKDDSKSETGVSKWAQKTYPRGRGIELATKGREARGHYDRIRGNLF